MGIGYWARVATMVCALIAVIWAMRHMNSGQVKVATPIGPLTLCATRISWVEAGGVHLEEHKTHWMRTVNGGGFEEVDGTEAEKWFSRLCSAKIDLVKAEGEFKPAFKLGYISREIAEVSENAAGEFQLSGQSFKSTGLDEALRTLPKLPEAAKPGHP